MIFIKTVYGGDKQYFYKQRIRDHMLVLQEKRGKKRKIMLLGWGFSWVQNINESGLAPEKNLCEQKHILFLSSNISCLIKYCFFLQAHLTVIC